jgi:hypothetical protein
MQRERIGYHIPLVEDLLKATKKQNEWDKNRKMFKKKKEVIRNLPVFIHQPWCHKNQAIIKQFSCR